MRSIDELLDANPKDLAPPDIDALIEWTRKTREEGTGKLKKETGPKAVISLEELGLAKPKPKLTFKRRV